MWTSVVILAFLSQGDKEADEAIQKFKVEIKSPDISARAAAVTELGRSPHEKTLRILGTCLTTDDKSVRIAAAKALGQFPDRKTRVVSILEAALGANPKEHEVEIEIFHALRQLGDPSALGTAYRYFDEKNGKVAESAVEVAGAIKSKESVDPLIRLLKRQIGAGEAVYGGSAGGYDVPADESLRERARLLDAAVNKALAAITGERFSTAKEWEAWWRKNSGSFKVKS